MKWWVLLGCSLSFSVFHANRVLMQVILPLVTDEFGLSYFSASVLAASYDIGYLLSLLPIGYLALGYRKKRAILSGMAIIFITSLAAGLYSSARPALLSYRLAAGIGFSFYFTAGHALLAAYFPSRERGRAFGFHTGGSAFGRLYGSALLGLIAGAVSWRFSFVALAVVTALFMVMVALVLRGVKEEKEERNNKDGMSLTYFFKQKPFLVTSLINSFAFAFFMVFMTFFSLYLTKVNGLSVKAASLLMALASVATILANPWVGGLSDRFGRKRISVMVFSLSAFFCLLFPFVRGLALLIIFSLALGLVISSNIPVIMGHLTEIDPRYASTAGMGAYNTISGGLAFLFTIAFGYLADLLGLKAVYFGLGIIMALVAFLAGNMLRPRPVSA